MIFIFIAQSYLFTVVQCETYSYSTCGHSVSNCIFVLLEKSTIFITTAFYQFEEPIFTYEDPDLLSKNGTIGGDLMEDYS